MKCLGKMALVFALCLALLVPAAWAETEATGSEAGCENHTFADGVCTVCGYVCENHTGSDDLMYADSAKTYNISSEGHAAVFTRTASYTCTTCGKVMELPAETVEEELEGHTFESGVCTVCGYTCEHTWVQGECMICLAVCPHEHTTQSSYTMVREDSYSAINETYHSAVCDGYEEEQCSACGMTVRLDIVEEGLTENFKHDLDSEGVCKYCGYVYTAPAPVVTPTPAPQPEQQPQQEPEQKTAAVVKRPAVKNEEDTYFESTPAPVPESQPMVQTLMAVVESAEQQGEQVSIEIVGAAEIMEAEEHAQLKALPVQEQILVTLSSIGFDEVVEAAAAAMNLTLSGEAQALREQINARISSLTQEESEQLQEKLTAYFPVEEITANGETYAYFVIELRIEVDGAARIERYGFRLDDETGEWIFVSLSTLEAQ